jgi:acyl-coenzyme A thioesterase PaaI-like protein
MLVNNTHLNSGNFAHGGFLMSFLDNVMGNAAFKSFDKAPCVTISMTTHFTHSASIGDELIAQPIIEKKTKTLSFVNCQVFAGDNLIVSGSGIWKIVHRKSTNTVNDKIIKDDGGW